MGAERSKQKVKGSLTLLRRATWMRSMKTLFHLFHFFTLLVWAGPSSLPMGPTAQEELQSEIYNRAVQLKHWRRDEAQPNTLKVLRPFSEVEEAGYLLFHSDTGFGSKPIKDTLAKNLPSGTKLLVYTSRGSAIGGLKSHYESLAGQGNVEIAALDYSLTDRAIWARDNTPIPVLLAEPDSAGKGWAAVDAKYYGGDEPDLELSRWFHIGLLKNPFQFEGGNFVADSKGNCVVVNKKPTAKIPDSIFTDLYGCKNIVRLKHVAGIGHADERVKFINDHLVLTDTESYAPQLSELGYEVRLLPIPEEGEYRTYVNSLSLNDRIFVPVFGEPNDTAALEIYSGLGLQVIPVNTSQISDNGNGSIHCITMTYPKMALEDLKRLFR